MQMERRRFVSGAVGGGAAAAMAAWFPAWAQSVSSGITAPLPTVSGNDITLRIARQTMRIDGKVSRAIGDKWLVDEGLNAGDKLIVEGLQKVKAGATVTASERGSEAAAAKPAAGA